MAFEGFLIRSLVRWMNHSLRSPFGTEYTKYALDYRPDARNIAARAIEPGKPIRSGEQRWQSIRKTQRWITSTD